MSEDETITGIKDLAAMIIERDKRIDELEADLEVATVFNQGQLRQLATLKEKARAAVNAPYEDILDMGLAEALKKLAEALPPP